MNPLATVIPSRRDGKDVAAWRQWMVARRFNAGYGVRDVDDVSFSRYATWENVVANRDPGDESPGYHHPVPTGR
ncbi:MAG: hypothetical protein HYS23_02020 [Geobacter sp.]|nr:hypothetical protein [Geobacter sp.]